MLIAIIFIGFIVWACCSGSKSNSVSNNGSSTQKSTIHAQPSIPISISSTEYRPPIVSTKPSSPRTIRSTEYRPPVPSVKASSPRVSTTTSKARQTPEIAALLNRPAVTVVSSGIRTPQRTMPSPKTSLPPKAGVQPKGSNSTTKQAVRTDSFVSLKPNYQAFLEVLKENGICYLYHFTDRRNIESIKKHGGLYSWDYCGKHNITIPYAGGNSSSRNYDARYGLQDYVRLSFCDDHPMMWRLKQQGYDLVLLKIKIDAAVLRDTLFSDMNATDSMHSHGASLEDLKKVRFSATRRHYVGRNHADFKHHQAEVMVKTFIPAKYIVNLDFPPAA